MIWTAWNNGEHHQSGAGYGMKVSIEDRDRYFKRSWNTALIELPSDKGFVTAEASVAKKSFWGPQCREMICSDIGRWLRDEGYVP